MHTPIAFAVVKTKDLASVALKARVDAVAAQDAYDDARLKLGNRITLDRGRISSLIADHADSVVRLEECSRVARYVAEEFERMTMAPTLADALESMAGQARKKINDMIDTGEALTMSTNAITNHLDLVEVVAEMKAWRAVLANCEVLMRGE